MLFVFFVWKLCMYCRFPLQMTYGFILQGVGRINAGFCHVFYTDRARVHAFTSLFFKIRIPIPQNNRKNISVLIRKGMIISAMRSS